MDFGMDIERLRRRDLVEPEEEASPSGDASYRAFWINVNQEPQRRLVIGAPSLRRQVIPLYDLLYNIVTDWQGRIIILVYPFMTVKIHGRHLQEIEQALTWHVCTRIDEFDHATDLFAEGLDLESVPIITAIEIEGEEDHGLDAEAESQKYRARLQHEAQSGKA